MQLTKNSAQHCSRAGGKLSDPESKCSTGRATIQIHSSVAPCPSTASVYSPAQRCLHAASGDLKARVGVEGVAQLVTQNWLLGVVGQLEQVEAGGGCGETPTCLLLLDVEKTFQDRPHRVTCVLVIKKIFISKNTKQTSNTISKNGFKTLPAGQSNSNPCWESISLLRLVFFLNYPLSYFYTGKGSPFF